MRTPRITTLRELACTLENNALEIERRHGDQTIVTAILELAMNAHREASEPKTKKATKR